MTADNPAARVDLDAHLSEAEREALVLAFIEGWMSEVDEDDAEYLRTDDTTREAAVLYAEVVNPAVERILADRLAPLLAERDEARAERAKAWDDGWDTGQLWAFSDLDEHDRSTNPYGTNDRSTR
jgi:hypothetical protein